MASRPATNPRVSPTGAPPSEAPLRRSLTSTDIAKRDALNAVRSWRVLELSFQDAESVRLALSLTPALTLNLNLNLNLNLTSGNAEETSADVSQRPGSNRLHEADLDLQE